MKFLRFGEKGLEKPGVLDANGQIRDLSSIIKDIDGNFFEHTIFLNQQALDIDQLPIVEQENLRIGACVADVGKFIGIGLNYIDHANETGAEIPKEPIIFNKWTSSIIGPNDDIKIPVNSVKTDWEVELGIIIGKSGSYIDIENAMEYVAGYCVVNDISEREYQLQRGGSWDKGKGCDTFGPIGPWFVTKDEINDPQNLSIWLEVDGVRYQNGTTANMIFDVPKLISYVSQFMSLHPGDIISTGTPAGVGMGQTPPLFLRPNQTVRLGIDGLGEQLQNTVDYK
ncbi:MULTISPECIES: fumarylacetoacetate hydrolase family protein [Acinetobacter]|uniref:fumarylacetoacetate hydrolase family protein n=1 Tax=Acinetobacter TaxID=469 RepID=UPI000F743B7A|nr:MULTISPECIES: fumarylacetoacetate hydrolase family protein [Acinetobacter]MCU4387336.1 fumarylacetoacetate hydrolase family protein [Acinetobacter haemolyticus]RSN74759.1 FAA hydrolase family protein [Acinetobacter haemolyticus]